MKLKTPYLTGFVVLAAIVTVGVMAYSTVWQLAILGLLPCLVGVVGVILALVALIVRRRARIKESPGLGRVSKMLLLIGIFLLLQGAYLPIALGIRNLELKRTYDFIDALIPKLEAYKDLNNEYPASLDSILTDGEEVPRLLQLNGDFPVDYDNRQFYSQSGESYGFHFYLPDGFIGFRYAYCCGADGTWTVTD